MRYKEFMDKGEEEINEWLRCEGRKVDIHSMSISCSNETQYSQGFTKVVGFLYTAKKGRDGQKKCN